MKPEIVVAFTWVEAMAIYDLLNTLSGGNARDAFSWDGTDTLDDDNTRSLAKLFKACNRRVPNGCEEVELK